MNTELKKEIEMVLKMHKTGTERQLEDWDFCYTCENHTHNCKCISRIKDLLLKMEASNHPTCSTCQHMTPMTVIDHCSRLRMAVPDGFYCANHEARK